MVYEGDRGSGEMRTDVGVRDTGCSVWVEILALLFRIGLEEALTCFILMFSALYNSLLLTSSYFSGNLYSS